MTRSLIHVVDDDPALRDSLALLLGTAGFEVALYEGAASLLDRLTRPTRGCILTDIHMPGLDGLELLRRLRAEGHTLPVVMMTGHAEIPMAVETMKLGACDFIEKPFADEVLLHALHAALERGGVTEADDPALQAFVRRVDTLSTRERQVMDQLVTGETSKEIGRTLDISPRTVEIYRAKLMAKTQAASLSELVRWTVLASLGQA
ncbi:response regulator FixJ [Methylobacterium sp. CM6257]